MASRTVKLSTGRVLGRPARAGGVWAFKAIPYAAAPTGALRWRPPQPPAAWSGIRNGVHFGDACVQPLQLDDSLMRPLGFARPAECGQSEDCLFVNVWTPANARLDPLPVIVFIHGGGHRVGSGSHPATHGDHLAAKGCVVVTLNYRLGALGYLAHPALAKESGSSGNFAALDVVAALRWVRTEIASFGGDPERVTLYGQSAGAALVNLLMASPLAVGLFHRAIAVSGGCMGHLPSAAQTQAAGQALTADLGAHDAAQLRTLSPDAIVAPRGFWGPSVDGEVVQFQPAAVFDHGRQSRIPLMVGWTTDEAAPYPAPDAMRSRQGFLDHAASYGKDADRFLALYDTSTDAAALASSYAFRRDSVFAFQPWRMARAHAASGAPTWLFTWKRPVPLMPNQRFHEVEPPGGYGAWHGTDLWYGFGNLQAAPFAWTQTDRSLSKTWMDAVLRFAADGAPNCSGLPNWPPAKPACDRAMLIDDCLAEGPVAEHAAFCFFESQQARATT